MFKSKLRSCKVMYRYAPTRSREVGWSSEQPGLGEDVPAHGGGVGTRWSLRSLPTQTILWSLWVPSNSRCSVILWFMKQDWSAERDKNSKAS